MATKFELQPTETIDDEQVPPPRSSARRWMIGSLALLLLVAVGLAAWLALDHSRTTTSTGASTSASSIKYQALGTPVTLTSADGQTRLTVNVTRWRQPGPPGMAESPQPGNVIALANVEVTNTSPEPATLAFSAFTAIGSDGRKYPALHSDVAATVPPVVGFGPDFEIPATVTITSIQVSLGSGPNSTGRWVVHR